MSKILGQLGEQVVQKFFEQQGWVCCDHNVSFREGELDLVFRAGRHLLFVEVKTRARSQWDRAYPRMSFQKIHRFLSSIHQYLEVHPCRSYEVKVVFVTLDAARRRAQLQCLELKDFYM